MPQCTAKSKRTQQRCKRPAIKGRTKCYHHGGVVSPDAGAPVRNVNAKKHGIYAKVIFPHLSPEEREAYQSIDPNAELDEEIRLCRYKLTQLEKWIAENQDEDDFKYPSDAYEKLQELLRKLIKDKKDREFRAVDADKHDGKLDELTEALKNSRA